MGGLSEVLGSRRAAEECGLLSQIATADSHSTEILLSSIAVASQAGACITLELGKTQMARFHPL